MNKICRIGCVGRRDTTKEEEKLCFEIGAFITKKGWFLATGGACGADQRYMLGGNSVNPEKVILDFPWPGFLKKVNEKNNICENPRDEWKELAARHHEFWEKLSTGAKKLMTRNVGIVKKSDKLLALPNEEKLGMGGTGHGIRIAEELKIPLLNINGKKFEEIVEFLEK